MPTQPLPRLCSVTITPACRVAGAYAAARRRYSGIRCATYTMRLMLRVAAVKARRAQLRYVVPPRATLCSDAAAAVAMPYAAAASTL